ncbi:MAG: ABC transporter substrate-binding protein [Erysipelotrichaceae bacterium]|jgi:NitT/TauT family transport system substrate-binding protein
MKKKLIVLVIILFLFGCNEKKDEKTVLNIYSLKGPTTIGLAKLINDDSQFYNFNIETAIDSIVAALSNGECDIACLPANVASNLYNKTKDYTVLCINTLSVLYLVENNNQINSFEDLKGKTILLTGKGATPEYAIRHLLNQYGLENDVTLEFASEATEIVSILSNNSSYVGLLPQPFVMVALNKNPDLRICLDLNEVWNEVSSDSSLITGVTIVRNEILAKYEKQIRQFLAEYKNSVNYVNSNLSEAGKWIKELGIIENEQIATAAIPYCNIVYIDSEEMRSKLQGYLSTLLEFNPASIGNSLPDDNFYYLP